MSSSHSTKKKYTLVNTTTISLGCSSGLCRRPKLSAFFNPRPRSTTIHHHHSLRRRSRHHHSSGASSTTNTTATAAAFSESSNHTATTTTATDYYYDDGDDVRSLKAVQGFGRIGGASVAVEKDSDDPYLDFRQSMLQMILEREIYGKEDLKELLSCFLQLNSPYYHGTIVRAFTEIWNGVYSSRNGGTGAGGYAYSSHASPEVHGAWFSHDY